MEVGRGDNGITGPYRNLRSEAHVELKKANLAYTNCVT